MLYHKTRKIMGQKSTRQVSIRAESHIYEQLRPKYYRLSINDVEQK